MIPSKNGLSSTDRFSVQLIFSEEVRFQPSFFSFKSLGGDSVVVNITGSPTVLRTSTHICQTTEKWVLNFELFLVCFIQT